MTSRPSPAESTPRSHDPLRRLPRRDAELGGLDLFARLDAGTGEMALSDPVRLQLSDPVRLQEVLNRFRDGVLASLANQARVHGWHVQQMFAEVVRALDHCVLIKEEDQGSTWARQSETLCPPDFRVVQPDGTNLLIEVKNHRSSSLARPFRMRAADLAGLQRYADLTCGRALVALYWTGPALWFLIDPKHFTPAGGTKVELDVQTMATENEMAILGDVMLGTVPPLELGIEVEETGRKPGDSGNEEVAQIVVRGVRILAGGHQLRGRAERRLAFYLLMNGTWPEDERHEFAHGRLQRLRFVFEPDEWPRAQGFAVLGPYSQLFARSFWLRTSSEGRITRLASQLDPRSEGFVIPDDYKSDELPLWRLHMQPKSTLDPA